MLLHYLGKLKNQKFALCMHVKHVSRVIFYHLSTRYLPNVMKISAKINTMQNINILLFVRSLSLTNLIKALQLSKVQVCLSTIKHQHGKNLTRWTQATWTKNTWEMQIVCKSFFTKSVQMSTICTDTCLETLSALVNCSVNDVLSDIGPYCI